MPLHSLALCYNRLRSGRQLTLYQGEHNMELNIGTNLKRLRIAKGITQEQLSTVMNVSCAAVSKWERGETYPDITLLQPLAFYFGVSLDELMGYDQEKVQAEIDEVVALYEKHWFTEAGRKIIEKAYHDYPNDYRIMHYYLWDICGGSADNDPAVLIAHKDEFLAICEKILEGCTDESIRLGAWNMRAKILHAEGKTEEALEIYHTKFANWFATDGQKAEQLFAKDTDEYYFYVRKNMFELADFAADKLGRTVFFAPDLSMEEKTERSLQYGELMMDTYEKTNDAFFLVVAESFLGRMENDLCFRGGTDAQVIAVVDAHLKALKELGAKMKELPPLFSVYDNRPEYQKDLLGWQIDHLLRAPSKRRAELLQNPEYLNVLKKYQ